MKLKLVYSILTFLFFQFASSSKNKLRQGGQETLLNSLYNQALNLIQMKKNPAAFHVPKSDFREEPIPEHRFEAKRELFFTSAKEDNQEKPMEEIPFQYFSFNNTLEVSKEVHLGLSKFPDLNFSAHELKLLFYEVKALEEVCGRDFSKCNFTDTIVSLEHLQEKLVQIHHQKLLKMKENLWKDAKSLGKSANSTQSAKSQNGNDPTKMSFKEKNSQSSIGKENKLLIAKLNK